MIAAATAVRQIANPSTSLRTGLSYQTFNRRMGLWLFIFSESMVFLALLASRFYMQGTFRPAEMNQGLGLIITSILLLSSFTANRAEVAIAHGDRSSFLRLLTITIVLGVVFLAGVVTIEWPETLHYAPLSTGFGTLFFAITGLHAFHVLTGVFILALVGLHGWRGRYTAQDHWGAEGSIIYWHFVDVVWVLVYPTLYLIG
ncbi:MAG: heme-copper oxidase subunit III [Chloroflexi bacterium]|nr:heme-copper oxidase subunit III [Chloroflexota bacterium]